jgi:hypothetical protein
VPASAFPFDGAKFVCDDDTSSRQTLTLCAEAPESPLIRSLG